MEEMVQSQTAEMAAQQMLRQQALRAKTQRSPQPLLAEVGVWPAAQPMGVMEARLLFPVEDLVQLFLEARQTEGP